MKNTVNQSNQQGVTTLRSLICKIVIISSLSSLGIASSFEGVFISNLTPPNEITTKLNHSISGELSYLEEISEGEYSIEIGLKFLSPELSLEENKEYFVTSSPDLHLSSFNLPPGSPQDSIIFDTQLYIESLPIDLETNETVSDVNYLFVISAKKNTSLNNNEESLVISDELENEYGFIYLDNQEIDLIEADKPSLALGDLSLSKNSAYTYSPAEAPDTFRVNAEVVSHFGSISELVELQFSLITTKGEFFVSIKDNYEDSSIVVDGDKISLDFSEGQYTESLYIELEYDEQILSVLEEGELFYIRAKLDPNSSINEWLNNTDDNSKDLPIIVLN